jgi:hypothetical protein
MVKWYSPCGITVQCSNWFCAVNKDAALNQDLSSISGIDSSIHAIEIGVVDVASTISQARGATANVVPVVVVLSNVKMSGIFCGIVVAMANEGRLPVVMEIDIGNGNPF